MTADLTPWKLTVADADLDELRRRLRATMRELR